MGRSGQTFPVPINEEQILFPSQRPVKLLFSSLFHQELHFHHVHRTYAERRPFLTMGEQPV